MQDKDRLGQRGEELAIDHLTDVGMIVLDRNWRCGIGEIDVVAQDGNTIVVCEIKTRSGLGYGAPVEGVDEVKLTRLHRLGRRWLAANDIRARAVRVDVIGILARPGHRVIVDHLRGLV